ncbi:histidine phosphatase family protein [Pseudonocardia hispaniensis]|uniref:Histidine phosphatase family protein n=1 Tax=Pseudonocardia hispaniensis TaxID=904933 RepID=A0ABW1IXV7_9PSEU
MQLIFVRHALPHRVSAAELAATAAADPGLTELGERQAARLVGALAGEEVTALYSSTMARAVGTAAPLATALDQRLHRVAELAEYDVNDRHYIPVHKMERLAPEAWQRLTSGLLPSHIDAEAFRSRVVGAVESIVVRHAGRETAVLVAHAGVINVYLAHLLGIPRPLVFPLDYAGITRVLAGRDGRRTVRSVNETAHVCDLLAPELAPE